MGVPKFYRWISERYPCLSEVVKEHQIPEFDNLYLDMNGIIHQCSHPNDEDVHFRISEEKIFADIFHYLEVLFRIIKPRKVFFMAVDGVAPRAKMNQQRGRRFRSAKEAEDKIKKALDKGEVLPTEARFDSNCITPGTDFMARLQEQLKYFVHNKLSTDKLWHNVKVYLSGHETPGEGEHKIMEFIRSENSKPSHDPNTRHCLYGLDADLIMLGLTSHEPHFSLLREEVRFGGKKSQKRITAPEETTFHLLHLSLMREYIDYEFSWLKNFEKYMEKLSEFDREHFNEVFVDLKWFESKVGNKYLNESAGLAAEKESDASLGLSALTSPDKETEHKEVAEDDDEEEEDDLFETEFRQYKRTYYMTKMAVDVVSDEFLAQQAKCYVEGIQWILHYYYHGVQSWSWYYPYHYAPFLSDIRNISDLKLTFELGEPFMPFQQLLAVLPAASMGLLPECYRHLMTSENSPIIEYYPVDFKTDLNGKQQEWEAVVLIPFIDEVHPFTAKALVSNRLHIHLHSASFLACCRKANIPVDAWHVSSDHVVKHADRSSLYFCGFPTLQHIKHKFYKKKSGVVVFQQSSRGENMMLEILPTQEGETICDNVAAQVLGKPVFVNWPHLEEARIVAVSDGETKFILDEPPGVQKVYEKPSSPPPTKVTYLSDKEQKDWVKDVQGITEFYLKRKGIVINDTDVVLYGQLLTGRKYVPQDKGALELEKQWAKQVLPFAYQAVVKDIEAFYSSLTSFKSLDELFPPATTVFMVGAPYYGAMGEVQDSQDVLKDGRIRVVFSVPHEPQMDHLIQNQHKYSVRYSPGYVLASRLGISGYLVSRFSGSIFIGRGSKRNPCGEQKSNVGLNLKFNKKNEEVPGYTKRSEKEWLYSAAVEELLAEYLDRFSEVFDAVSRNSHDDIFYEDDIWPGVEQNGAERVAEITSWLRSHPVSSISRASCDLQVLDAAIVEKIEEAVEKTKMKKSTKKVRVTVKPHLLFRPLEQLQGVVPDPDAEYRLFDRVVNIREGFTVPLGLRGTVIGIKGAEREAEVLYEVLFDEEFAGGLIIRCASPRAYRLPPFALINLSHGVRTDHGFHKLTAIVKPQPSTANFYSNRQMGGLNHSPRSPFVPTQVQSKEDYNNVWQTLQRAGPPTKPPAHWQNNVSKQWRVASKQKKMFIPSPESSGVLKTPSDTNSVFGGMSEFEILISSLKVTESSQQAPPPAPTQEQNSQSEGPLSPQSFAMKGTLVLKEMLKIDSGGQGSPSSQETANTTASADQPQNRRRSSKKLGNHLTTFKKRKELLDQCCSSCLMLAAAKMNAPQGGSPVLPSPTPAVPPNAVPNSKVSELACVCMGLGMTPPDFSFLRNRQGFVVCQVKLSNGLMVHEHFRIVKHVLSPNDLGDKMSGFGFFPGGLLLPHQGYPHTPLWGMALPPHQHPNQPFYATAGTFPGAARPQTSPSVPIGSHNQFIPLQVTKKRASANKKNQETREFYSAAHTVAKNQQQRAQNQQSGQLQPHGEPQSSQQETCADPSSCPSVSTATASLRTPPRQSGPRASHTPGSSSKRKHRKLAVNFEAAKVSE
uniref:5'-3' exoribonuclease 1 n=1 Tax=Oryzias sinensis TaxID=183150 RepID=A0A8C8DNR1_9TELE